MRGRVLSVANGSEPGTILGDDHARYRYAPADLVGAAAEAGQEVLFDVASGRARNIHVVAARSGATALHERDWVAFYLSPRGRIARKDYWLYGVLVVFLAQVLVAFLLAGAELSLVATVLSFGFGWAGIALAFKRFQDRGYSGWWSLLPYGLMLLAVALVFGGPLGLPGTDVGLLVMRVGFVVAMGAVLSSLWAYLWVPIGRGEPGYNRFGPDPLRGAA